VLAQPRDRGALTPRKSRVQQSDNQAAGARMAIRCLLNEGRAASRPPNGVFFSFRRHLERVWTCVSVSPAISAIAFRGSFLGVKWAVCLFQTAARGALSSGCSRWGHSKLTPLVGSLRRNGA
jgi:hypothetical protein